MRKLWEYGIYFTEAAATARMDHWGAQDVPATAIAYHTPPEVLVAFAREGLLLPPIVYAVIAHADTEEQPMTAPTTPKPSPTWADRLHNVALPWFVAVTLASAAAMAGVAAYRVATRSQAVSALCREALDGRPATEQVRLVRNFPDCAASLTDSNVHTLAPVHGRK